MKKARSLVVRVLIVAFAGLFVFGIANESLAQKTFISIAGGGPGGAFCMVAGGMSEWINKTLPDVNASAQGTAAGAENMKLFGAKAVDLGLYCSDVAMQALKAQKPFSKPITNVRSIGMIFKNEFNVIIKKKQGITTYAQLRDQRKVIAGGAVGSGMLEASKKLFPNVFGIDMKYIKTLGYRPGNDAFKDNRVDAVAQQTPHPYPLAMELATTEDVVFLSMTEKERDLAVKLFPEYGKRTMPAGVYRGQDYPVHSVGCVCLVGAREDIPEELVYRITKTLYSEDGLSYLRKVHRILKPLTLDVVVDWSMEKQVVPLHPGAVRYYKELAKKFGREWKSAE